MHGSKVVCSAANNYHMTNPPIKQPLHFASPCLVLLLLLLLIVIGIEDCMCAELSRDDSLERLVRFVNTADSTFCQSPFSESNNDVVDPARLFQPAFDILFSSTLFASSQYTLAPMRWSTESSVEVDYFVYSTKLLQAYVNTTGGVDSVNNVLMSILNTCSTFSSNHSLNVVGIGLCRGRALLGKVDNGRGDDYQLNDECAAVSRSNLTRMSLSQSSQSSLNGRAIVDGGELKVAWQSVPCRPSTQRPVTIRLVVEPSDHHQRPGTDKLRIFFDIDMRSLKLDQCAIRINHCDPTTECEYHVYNEQPFSMDNYICRCNKLHFTANKHNGFPAPLIRQQLKQAHSTDRQTPLFQCQFCSYDCARCEKAYQLIGQPINSSTLDDLGCYSNQLGPSLLRDIPLSVQSFCITICLILGLVIFRLRRNRIVKAANWILMELLLLGAIMLYLKLAILYLGPNNKICIILPWLREIGFSLMYGALIVKIYRVLAIFQSRKAHRVHVKDKDLLKFLGVFVMTTFAYMTAWTALNLDYLTSSCQSIKMVELIRLPASNSFGQQLNASGEMLNDTSVNTSSKLMFEPSSLAFHVCRTKWWDAVTKLTEFLILLSCLYYCRLVRSAPSEFNETRFISIALMVEAVVSALVHIIKHVIWDRVLPEHIYLLHFIHLHLTVTVNLALIFGPKAWYLYRPTGGRFRPGTGQYQVDANLAAAGKLNLALNGDLDIADVNLVDMDPEVIRTELKRLYTQIELYKTKAMRKDNPHVSKRRGGRKQRRFSLQPFYKKHHSQTNYTPPVASYAGGTQCNSPCQPDAPTSSSSKQRSSSRPTGGSSNPTASRTRSYGIVHDEEFSKLSEESTNSTEDPTASLGQKQCTSLLLPSPDEPSSTGVRNRNSVTIDNSTTKKSVAIPTSVKRDG